MYRWTSHYLDMASNFSSAVTNYLVIDLNQPAGADIPVDHRNVHLYIDRVLDVMLAEGVRIPFLDCFRWDLQTVSTNEILSSATLMKIEALKVVSLSLRYRVVIYQLSPTP